MTLRERFERKVSKHGPIPTHRPELGPCWLWLGSRKPSGHGQISSGGPNARLVGAHRVSYELAVGPVAPDMEVCHHCDNPPCVNPTHLFVGTHADNMRDMAEKGRSGPANRPERMARGDRHGSRLHPERLARGARVGGAKLTDDDVRAIRSSTLSQRRLAAQYGVDRRSISFIRQGKTWSHLPGGAPLTADRLLALERSSAVLSMDQVRDIKGRLAAGETAPSVARALGVGKGAVYSIKYGYTWKEVS